MAAEDVQLADANGDPLVLASQIAEEALTNGDPYFIRGSITYMFLQAGSSCPAPSPNIVCTVSLTDTPIQDAINAFAAMPVPTLAAEKIITVEYNPLKAYTEHVTINVSNMTLLGVPASVVGASAFAPVIQGTTGAGITITAEGVTVSGFNITGFEKGIYIPVISGNNALNITYNTITGNGIGIDVTKAVGSPALNIQYNQIFGNTYGLVNNDGDNNQQFVDAPNNYWGCPTGPVVAHVDKKDGLTHYYQFNTDGSGKDIGTVRPAGCELLGGKDALYDMQINTKDWSPYKINLDPFIPCLPGQILVDDECVTPVESISIAKSVDETNYDATTDTLTYHYVITNTGNVSLTGQFTVTDDKINGGTAFNCGVSQTLAPLATVSCTQTYHITQADLN
ncbi:hypothetical protein EG832_17125, partial [bacterium]|nr:hypothetical protein [bacterium]